MQGKICCFCGHRMIITENLENRIELALISMIENGYNTFYSGSMGDFDKLCEKATRRLKRKYNIRLCRIMYYYRNDIENTVFDEVIMPDLEGVHYKRAITKRNEWMAEKADGVLCYVYKDYGGAFIMKRYAEKLGREIINLF